MHSHDSQASPPPGEILAFPASPQRRLRLALRELDRAIDEQKHAVAAFRAQLRELNGSVARLGEGAQTLQGALHGAASEVVRARAVSRQLLATAERMEATARR
jgi:multidrug resistance efflux pump